MKGFSYWDGGNAIAAIFCAGKGSEKVKPRTRGEVIFVSTEAIAVGGMGEEGFSSGERGEGEAVVRERREGDMSGGGDKEELFSVEVLGEEGVS